MNAWTAAENLRNRLGAMEAYIADAFQRVRCILEASERLLQLASQTVPLAEVEMLRDAASASKDLLNEKQSAVERLNRMLTAQQEECEKLRLRLQVNI